MSPSIAIIGLGRMAQAILLPLLENGDIAAGQVLGVVKKKESVKKLADKLPNGVIIVPSDSKDAKEAWEAPLKLLAVKPQQLRAVQDDLANIQTLIEPKASGTILVSILAGVKLAKLQNTFPDFLCVRAVPNAPSLVGEGLTGLSWGSQLNDVQIQKIKEIFHSMSEVFELPEDQLDAFLGLTSSGPAYIALIAEALADGAVAAGLPRKLALNLASKTISGTAKLLQAMDSHPGELKDMVASPAGTTIAALRHLEMSGVRSAFIEAVVVASERSRQLS